MSRSDREPTGPSNPELAQRLARVEEKQDFTVEKIEEIADSLDEDLDELEETQTGLLERNRKMWFAFQAVKWVGGPAGLIGVGITIAL